MELISKYIEVGTGETVGFLYQNGDYRFAVSKDFAQEHRMPEYEILDYLEIESTIEVGMYNETTLYRTESALYQYEDDVWKSTCGGMDFDLYYHCQRDEVRVGDYIFKKLNAVILDDAVAYERCLTGKDTL